MCATVSSDIPSYEAIHRRISLHGAEEDGDKEDDDEEDTEHGKLSKNDKPGCVMSTISKTVQQRTEKFCQIKMRLEEVTKLEWEVVPDFFRERDMMYGTIEFNVPAVLKHETDTTAATPLPITFGEHMPTRDVVYGQLKKSQVMSRVGSSQMWLC